MAFVLRSSRLHVIENRQRFQRLLYTPAEKTWLALLSKLRGHTKARVYAWGIEPGAMPAVRAIKEVRDREVCADRAREAISGTYIRNEERRRSIAWRLKDTRVSRIFADSGVFQVAGG